MTLHHPFIIASNLNPGIEISGATISICPSDTPSHHDPHGKPCWAYEIELPNGERHEGHDLFGWGETQEMMGNLLAFIGSCGEDRRYREQDGETEVDEDSSEGLFPPAVAEWAAQNSDEISCIRCEIEETKNLIEE